MFISQKKSKDSQQIFPYFPYNRDFLGEHFQVWLLLKHCKSADMGLNSYVSQPFFIKLQVSIYGKMHFSHS